jgi:hypothetical protein
MFPFERSKTTIPGQTIRPNDGIFTNPRSCNHGSDIDHTRPETHQNLIHSIKEQRHPNRAACKRRDHTTQGALPGQMIKPNSGHSAIQTNGRRGPKLAVSGARAGGSSRTGFRRSQANDCRRSSARQPRQIDSLATRLAGAGGGDDRDRTDDPLLAKQVLSQLSYAPSGPCCGPWPGFP